MGVLVQRDKSGPNDGKTVMMMTAILLFVNVNSTYPVQRYIAAVDSNIPILQ